MLVSFGLSKNNATLCSNTEIDVSLKGMCTSKLGKEKGCIARRTVGGRKVLGERKGNGWIEKSN